MLPRELDHRRKRIIIIIIMMMMMITIIIIIILIIIYVRILRSDGRPYCDCPYNIISRLSFSVTLPI